jgi:hypothetical protein
VSYFIALRNGSPVRTLTAPVRGLVRLAAIAALLAVAIHPSATIAAEPRTETDRAGVTPVLAVAAWSVIDGDGTIAGHGFEADDGEDHFDEGDDEFDCANVGDDDDECEGADDRVDNDEGDGGCANFDDGEDRCLGDGDDHFDEEDDEFGARPAPTDRRLPGTSAAAPLDLSAPGALAAVIGLGAGSVWLLRRARS